MAKKKKEEEHENAERWMVSYADFMTLLFATFVVLYALAQIDIKEFDRLEESIKMAFNNSPISGGEHMMDGMGANVISQGGASENDAVIPPIMEYLSQKYEKNSMEAIKKEIEKALAEGNIEGVEAKLTDRGLVIALKDVNAFFHSGSAEITMQAQKVLDTVSKAIKSKFNSHMIRVEGHTDNMPTSTNSIYPSNWELSGARASSVARYMIDRHKLGANLFTVVGYGDTRPIEDNATPQGREKNRRVEIVVLKNQVAKYEPMGEETIMQKPTEIQKKIQKQQQKNSGLSDAARQLLKQGDDEDNVIILDEFNKPENQEVKKTIENFEKHKRFEKEKLNEGFS